jgi:hypothetical protein
MDESAWTDSEEDDISFDRTGQTDVLQCDVSSTRKGWLARQEVTLCVGLEGCEHPRVEYSHELGRGLMSNLKYLDLAERLSRSAGTDEDVRRVFNVRSVRIRIGEHQTPLTLAGMRTGPGYLLLVFSADVRLETRRADLHVEFSSILSTQHDWYRYRSTRTILSGLKVRLTAPFPIRSVNTGLWWCDPEHSDEQIDARRYTSLIAIPGPVPVGTDLLWMFRAQPRSEACNSLQ